MVSNIKALIPPAFEPLAIRLWHFLRPVTRLIFFGQSRHCPVCDSSCRFFLSHGPPTRKIENVVCPVCLSHSRHRLAWVYLTSHTNLLDGSPKRLLHIAPDIPFASRFQRVSGVDYVSADLESPHAMVKMDITNINWPDAGFDVIFCSHVLEHIPEDRQAMRELVRILKPGGWALIQVPTSDVATFEDPSITDPAERERLFLQRDHVRLYGLDIRDRLAAAGFEVKVIAAHHLLEQQQCQHMGVSPNEVLFYCRKPLGNGE
jgi:SAM-dependent methyltransferase